MNQPLLYDFPSVAITLVLFALIVAGNEFGFRAGRFIQNRTDTEIKALTGAIQASILGLLALLLGFTFSMAMQRYDNRSLALIDEANAIGTVILRVELLPGDFRADLRRLLDDYVDQRVAVAQVDLTRRGERQAHNARVAALQAEIWALAVEAAQADPRPVTSGAFLNALNTMIDSQGKRNALLAMHVPEVVLLLLFVVFIASGGILGYSSGLSGHRVIAPTLMVSLLIVLIVFIIIDLDRPRRGLIQVDQDSLLALQQDGRG